METFKELGIIEREDGFYDEDNCYYEDLESALQTGVLRFCGCGDPEQSLGYIKKALEQVGKRSESDFETWHGENKALFGEGGRWFIWYFLDREKFTEHGGSVPGWLTERGKEMLQAINKLESL